MLFSKRFRIPALGSWDFCPQPTLFFSINLKLRARPLYDLHTESQALFVHFQKRSCNVITKKRCCSKSKKPTSKALWARTTLHWCSLISRGLFVSRKAVQWVRPQLRLTVQTSSLSSGFTDDLQHIDSFCKSNSEKSKIQTLLCSFILNSRVWILWPSNRTLAQTFVLTALCQVYYFKVWTALVLFYNLGHRKENRRI